MRYLFLSLLLCGFPLLARAEGPPIVHLWEKGAPGFENRKDEPEKHNNVRPNGEYSVTNVHNPYVTVFLPPKDKATGAALILCPGGGHREMWVKHEGENEAQWLSEHGVAAFVLRYRLAREPGSPYKIAEHALQDGQRAVRLVRSRAKEWGVNPAHIGMMGFSAGGEVTALVSGHPDNGQKDASDPVDRESCRLNFQALVYSGPQGVTAESVTKEAPPTFLVVGDDDNAVRWLVTYYQALKKAGVSSELHIYAKTPHGFGYRPAKTDRPVDTWQDRFLDFLKVEGMLKKE